MSTTGETATEVPVSQQSKQPEESTTTATKATSASPPAGQANSDAAMSPNTALPTATSVVPETTDPSAAISTAASAASASIPEAITAISSMWSSWLTPNAEPAGQHQTSAAPAAPPSTATAEKSLPAQKTSINDNSAAAAAAAATDLLQGAGKMWNDMSATLKGAAETVDTSAINDGVSVIRQKSGRLMEDVSRSVQTLNISLQNADLGKSAEAISVSTRDLLDKASQSIEQGRKEALEIFVDKGEVTTTATTAKLTPAPWDASALPETERKYADTLRREMLKLVVDSIYSKKKRTALFLSDAARKNNFQFDFNKHADNARAALDADTNMRRLRAGLVPGKMKEEIFWFTYFYHLHRIRQTLVANNGVMPDNDLEEDDVDDATLFGVDVDGEAEELAALDTQDVGGTSTSDGVGDSGAGASEGGPIGDLGDSERNWEEDIDAAFKDDEE